MINTEKCVTQDIISDMADTPTVSVAALCAPLLCRKIKFKKTFSDKCMKCGYT